MDKLEFLSKKHLFAKKRFTCKACHKRSNFRVKYVDSQHIKIRCPKCFKDAVVRIKRRAL